MRSMETSEATECNDLVCPSDNDTDPNLPSVVTHPNPTTALLLTSKPVIHRPESGINPIVDAASYLFSLMGKLKHVKKYQQLDKLHNELVAEIENFKEIVESYPTQKDFLSEYLPISLYALCSTIDDIIYSTPWGQNEWHAYSLVNRFNEAPLTAENFLILLERLVLDPSIYIEVIEFFYFCLSLGFKGGNTGEFSHEQLEKMMNSLYKRIRAHRGNYNKTLSPFPVRYARYILPRQIKWEIWLPIVVVSVAILVTSMQVFKRERVDARVKSSPSIVMTTS